jgi:hypothetical protein
LRGENIVKNVLAQPVKSKRTVVDKSAPVKKK